jgi:hypothetical protein
MEGSLHLAVDLLASTEVDNSIKDRFSKFADDFSTWKACSWVVEQDKKWVLERISVRMDRGFLYVLEESQTSRRQISISLLGACEGNDRDRRFALAKSADFRSTQCAVVGTRGLQHPEFDGNLPLCLVFDSHGDRNTFVLGFKILLWYLDGARVDAVAKGTADFGALIEAEAAMEQEEDANKFLSNIKDLDKVDPIPDDLTFFLLRSVQDERTTHRLRSVTFVGRSERRLRPGIDLLLDLPDISRIHARFEVIGDVSATATIRLFDEGSFGGTFVNGEPVFSVGKQVFVGSVLKFGQHAMFVLEFNKSLLSASPGAALRPSTSSADSVDIFIKDIHSLGALRRCRLFVELHAVVHELLHIPIDQHRLILRVSVLDGPSGSHLAPPVTNQMADRLLSETLHYLRLGAVLKLHFESAAQSVLLLNSHGRMV